MSSNPRLVTTRGRIRGVVHAWRRAYGDGQGTRHGGTLRRLRQLDLNTCHEDDVTAVIGNGSWTRITCDNCGERVPAAVVVGEPPDYESATATVCESCLRSALALFEADQ